MEEERSHGATRSIDENKLPQRDTRVMRVEIRHPTWTTRKRRYRFALSRIEPNALRLASLGWTIPMWLDVAHVSDILTLRSRQKIDAYFVQSYADNDFARLNMMADAFCRLRIFRRWHALLRQCVSAHIAGYYLVVAPALFTVLEGIVSNAERSNGIRVRNLVATRIKAAEARLPGSVTVSLWKSVGRFVDRLFESRRFDGPRPRQINRHWILHGRDASRATQADSTRLFHAIDTFTELVS